MPPADPASPLADGELDALFAPIAGVVTIALAVSGGADSLALLATVDRWRARNPGVRPVVLTVDHRLQEGSDTVAARVAGLASARGLDARILVRRGPRPDGDVEAAARLARYRLLLDAAREAGASHLLLAHHRDDQAETFLMRLQRGSGVFGLAAMRREIDAAGIVIFRPFLDVPRSRLAATTAAEGLTPFDDPMNRDPRFLRTRIRRLMPFLAAEGFDAAILAGTAARLAVAADAIDVAADRLIVKAVTVDALAVATLDLAAFLAEPEEIRRRLLARLLIAVGGDPYPPRFERLEALHAAMAGHAGGRFKRTLGGAVVEWRSGRFAVYRESGRAGLPAAEVGPGYSGVWDHRFEIRLGEDAPQGLRLAALGEDGRKAVAVEAMGAPPGAIAALPALRRGEAIIAVPGLAGAGGLQTDFAIAIRQIVGDRIKRPPRFPEFGPG